MIRSLTAGVLVVGMFAGGAAFAQGPRAGGPGRAGRAGGPGGAGLPLASLNMTQAQQDAIATIRERNRAEMEALQARMRDEILSVLTPDQKTEVQKVEAERAQRKQVLSNHQPPTANHQGS